MFLFNFVLIVFCLVAAGASDVCETRTKCADCIRISHCSWCSSKSSKSFGCRSQDRYNDCPVDDFVNPQYTVEITQDEPFSEPKTYMSAVVMKPQKVKISNLRLGQPVNITAKYRVPKDYPVDLYFLMDLSNSMHDDKQNLEVLGDLLAETMRNLTTSFKLGFGSFVDKNAVPFVEWTDAACDSDTDTGCSPTYSFKNHVHLTEDINAFKYEVRKAAIIYTRDVPEGGLDALLQAMVCKEQIGWRDHARRLIVLATDALSHAAGHGKIGGIVDPNDGHCHLDKNMYSMSLQQDYPSLGQISNLARENSMYLIMAVTSDVLKSYEQVSRLIKGSYARELNSDSRNIVTLISDLYQEISSMVELKDTAPSSIKTRYYTACSGSLVQEQSRCDHVKIGTVFEYTISVELTECPGKDGRLSFNINPLGLGQAFTIDIETACHCSSCSEPGSHGYEEDSEWCSGNGDLQCGVCQCDAEHSGDSCQCSGEVDPVELMWQCRADNKSAELCSAVGECICGRCDCGANPYITGRYCQCDDQSCDRFDGKFCSGNGECLCGRCSCRDGWKGSACDCKTTQESCIPVGGGNVCFGNGQCQCGSCQCSSGSFGKYCQYCPNCLSQCPELSSCVQCRVFQTGPLFDAGCDELCLQSIITYPNAISIREETETECSYQVDNDCSVKFIYGYNADGEMQIRVQLDPVCSEPLPLMAISLGLLVAMVIAGLAMLLLFKLYTVVHDRRECARFENERKNIKWTAETSPLYMEPISTFRNPAYNS